MRGYQRLQRCVSLCTQATSLKLDRLSSTDWEQARPYEEIPGPTRFELTRGFLPGGLYYKKSLTEYLVKSREKYGDIIRIPGMMGKKDMVMIFDVEEMKKVFRTEGVWPERPGMDSLVYYRKKYRADLYNKAEGLLGSVGNQWANFRTTVNPVLMQPRVAKTYVTPMQEVNSEFIQRIREIRDPESHIVPGNFIEDINRLAFESVAVVALNQQLGLIRTNLDSSDAKELFKNVQLFQRLVFDLEFKPSLYKYIWTPTFARYRKALDVIFEKAMGYVEDALQRYQNEKSDGARERELSVMEKLIKIDKSIAVVMAIDMLMAGVDTTSTTLTGILLEVATSSEKQAKIREEVRQFLPAKDSTFTAESMKNLPYLRACIKESIRLHSLGPGVTRAAGEDITLGGYRIPKGTNILLNLNLMLLEDKYFPRPNEFIPERWLRDGTMENEIIPFSYLPFGFGPRMCVGKRIVDLELEVTLARLVRNFYIEFNYPIENAFKNYFIITPNIPLKFKFTEVEN